MNYSWSELVDIIVDMYVFNFIIGQLHFVIYIQASSIFFLRESWFIHNLLLLILFG